MKQAGGDLELSEKAMFPKKITNDDENDENDNEDGEDLKADEGFEDESVEVPATSEDLQTFDEVLMNGSDEDEEEEEEVEEVLLLCDFIVVSNLNRSVIQQP